MTISENIARYRKQKGYTQEQLGEIVGVTNQAVSKWESAVSLPDIMLLPKIADALGVTLEELYGIDKIPEKAINRSDFYKSTNQTIIGLLYDQIGTGIMLPLASSTHNQELIEASKNPHTGKIDNITDNRVFKLYSETSGFAYISRDLSIIDPGYDVINDGKVFNNRDICAVLRKISDKNVLRLMSYMHTEECCNNPGVPGEKFLFDDLLSKCSMDEETLSEAMDKLMSLNIIERSTEDQIIKYELHKSKVIQLANILKIVSRFACETDYWWAWYGSDAVVCNDLGKE